MQEYEMFKELLNDSCSDDEITSIISEIRKYDVFDFLSKVSCLNLFPENQNKSILLDYIIAKIIEKKEEYYDSKIKISNGKFKNIMQQLNCLSLASAIDPNENTFIQRIMYTENYIVFNGVDYCPSFNLQNLIDVLFFYVNDYPFEFKQKVSNLINLFLGISNEIAINMNFDFNNIKRDESKKIIIPNSDKINSYSKLVIIDYYKVYDFIEDKNVLDDVIITFGTLDKGNMDNRSFFIKPFIMDKQNKKLIILNPSLIASFLFYKIIFIAENFKIKDELLARYNDYTFKISIENFRKMGHNKLKESQFGIFLENNKYYKERLLSVYNNQIMILTFVCDDGEEFEASVLHNNYPNKKHATKFEERMNYFSYKFKEKNINFDDIYILIIINSFGRGLSLETSKIPSNHNILVINTFELKCIRINERNNKNFIPKYILSKDRISVVPTFFSELNTIEIYASNDYSFYIDDNADFENTNFYFGMGDSVDYIDRAIKKEDLQLVKSYKKDWNAKIELLDDYRFIYTEADNEYENILPICIKFDFGIVWLTAGNFTTYEEFGLYKSLLDCISYWFAELRSEIDRHTYYKDFFHFNIKINGNIENCFYDDDEEFSIEDIVSYEEADDVINIFLIPALFSNFGCETNEFEKKFICNLLQRIISHSIDGINFNQLSLSVFDNPMKKKFYAIKSNAEPFLIPLKNRLKTSVNKEDLDSLLDFAGRKILEFGKWSIGKVNDNVKSELINEIVSILYKKLQEEVEKLSPSNLIEQIYFDLEESIYCAMFAQKRYASEILLYPEKEEEFIKEYDSLNRTSMALKFLMEYIAAKPPKGHDILGIGKYEYLLAICSSIIDWAYKNDLFYYEIFNTPVEILKSKRIGMKQQEFNNMYTYSDKYRREKLYYNSTALLRKKYKVDKEDFSKDLDEAFLSDYGYTFGNFTNVIYDLIEYGSSTKKTEVFVECKDKIIGFLCEKEKSMTKEQIKKVLDDISLSKRDDFLKLPPKYKRTDVYPWRFNRSYSFNRRPIIIRDDDIIWGNRQLYHMLKYLQEIIFDGKIYTKDKKMLTLLGNIAHHRGKKFNAMIAEILEDLKVFDVKTNLTKINKKHIVDDNNNTLGDIDILLIDGKKHTIYVVEVKDFTFSRNPYEIHMEYEKMFVDCKTLCFASKHVKRVEWIKNNIEDVKKEFFLEDFKWQIKGLFIVHDQLISTKIYKKKIKVLSLNELNVRKIRSI